MRIKKIELFRYNDFTPYFNSLYYSKNKEKVIETLYNIDDITSEKEIKEIMKKLNDGNILLLPTNIMDDIYFKMYNLFGDNCLGLMKGDYNKIKCQHMGIAYIIYNCGMNKLQTKEYGSISYRELIVHHLEYCNNIEKSEGNLDFKKFLHQIRQTRWFNDLESSL
tara:strand:+ start:16 stop:510 length:495 start_codon:yes stop_codon:yes gene_type:complete